MVRSADMDTCSSFGCHFDVFKCQGICRQRDLKSSRSVFFFPNALPRQKRAICSTLARPVIKSAASFTLYRKQLAWVTLGGWRLARRVRRHHLEASLIHLTAAVSAPTHSPPKPPNSLCLAIKKHEKIPKHSYHAKRTFHKGKTTTAGAIKA